MNLKDLEDKVNLQIELLMYSDEKSVVKALLKTLIKQEE